MPLLIEKLWNWGHLEGTHNHIIKEECKMSPEGFAEEYGIKNSFIVSYGGNIKPPFADMAERFFGLERVKWSVLGDASTPLPEHELGNVPEVIEVASSYKNIDGAVVDDFFSPKRIERFTPDILRKMRGSLNDRGLDFWCVLYRHELEVIGKYLECFDGITFWIWKCEQIEELDEILEKLFATVGDKPLMLGVYLWDYGNSRPMDSALFKKQVECYFDLLSKGKIKGIVFCSNTVGDADLETNRILKDLLKKHGNEEI